MILSSVIKNEDFLFCPLSENSINLIITDPPYFVLPKGKKSFGKKYDFNWDEFTSINDFVEWTKSWYKKCLSLLRDDSFMFVFWSQKYLELGFQIFHPSRLIAYHYNNLVQGGNGDFAYDYEPIFVIKKGRPKLIPGKHSCILNYSKPQSNFKKDKLWHPTQKPLALYKHLVEISNLKEEDIVLDCFAGSGVLNRAVKDVSIGLHTILIEKNKEYFTRIKKEYNELQNNK